MDSIQWARNEFEGGGTCPAPENFLSRPSTFFGSTRTFWWALSWRLVHFGQRFVCQMHVVNLCVCAPAAYIARNLRRVRYADGLERERNEGTRPLSSGLVTLVERCMVPQWGTGWSPDRQRILCSLDRAVRKPLLDYRPNIQCIQFTIGRVKFYVSITEKAYIP